MQQTPPAAEAPAPAAFYHRVGEITRSLHDALRELGYDKQIETSVGQLPDARARLSLIARLTGQAAEKVLDTVDAAQAGQQRIEQRLDAAVALLDGDPGPGAASLRPLLEGIRQEVRGTSAQLTDIMLAQDFHDLTGQTVRKVVEIAGTLEASLVQLLLDASAPRVQDSGALAGPVADPTRPNVVSSQAQVDELLESLGF